MLNGNLKMLMQKPLQYRGPLAFVRARLSHQVVQRPSRTQLCFMRRQQEALAFYGYSSNDAVEYYWQEIVGAMVASYFMTCQG